MTKIRVLMKLISFFIILAPLFGAASESTAPVRGTLPSYASQGCQAQPGCGECGSYTCSNTAGICNDGFSPFPANPYHNTFMTFSKSYKDPTTCNVLGVTCNGGETTCKYSHIPNTTDAVLSQINPPKQIPNNATCNFYDPSCGTCCRSWENHCYNYHTCYDSCCSGTPSVCTACNPHNCC